VPVERMAGVVKQKTGFDADAGSVASSPSIKLWIQREGWYRIEQPQLVGGRLVGERRPEDASLFVDGQEVPIR